jgi:hypothetical protein
MNNFIINITPTEGWPWLIYFGALVLWILIWVIVRLAAWPHLKYDGKGRFAIGLISIVGGIIFIFAAIFVAGGIDGAVHQKTQQAIEDEGYTHVDLGWNDKFTAEAPDGQYVEGFLAEQDKNSFIVTVK